jgi:hypothetical protein
VLSFTAVVTDFPAAGVATACGGASVTETLSVDADSGSALCVAGAVVGGCIMAALDTAGRLSIDDGR